jgi:hypothetical protein
MQVRDRIVVMGALGFVATAPFLLTMCASDKPPAATPAAAPQGNTSAETTSSPVETGPSPATSEASPVTSASAPPAPPPVAPDPPPYKGPIPKDCAEIDKAIKKAFTEQLQCKADDDCGNFAGNCACDGPIAKSAIPKLQALHEADSAKECYRLRMKQPPRPCPTCAPPPPRHCVAGKCQ